MQEWTESTVGEGAHLPRLFGSDVGEVFAILGSLPSVGDEIGDGCSLFGVNTVELFDARIRDFSYILREFNLRHEGIAVFDGCEFVDGAKFSIAVGSDETFAHTFFDR